MENEDKKEKKIEAEIVQQISCPDLEGKFVLVRVGDNHRPATTDDIDEITEKLEKMFEENGINCLTFVTHHAISIDLIEKRGI
jgi:hypothetical protein